MSENDFSFWTRQADAAHSARWRGSDLGFSEAIKDKAAEAAENAIEKDQDPEEGKRLAAEAARKVFEQSPRAS